MTIATKSSRSAMGFLNLWTTDKGTFPIVLIAGFAAVAAVGNATRYLLTHPDVCLDKAKRENSMHYSGEAGADWRARRFRFANISRNAINQSHQYDDLFAKAENQGVKR